MVSGPISEVSGPGVQRGTGYKDWVGDDRWLRLVQSQEMVRIGDVLSQRTITDRGPLVHPSTRGYTHPFPLPLKVKGPGTPGRLGSGG